MICRFGFGDSAFTGSTLAGSTGFSISLADVAAKMMKKKKNIQIN